MLLKLNFSASSPLGPKSSVLASGPLSKDPQIKNNLKLQKLFGDIEDFQSYRLEAIQKNQLPTNLVLIAIQYQNSTSNSQIRVTRWIFVLDRVIDLFSNSVLTFHFLPISHFCA